MPPTRTRTPRVPDEVQDEVAALAAEAREQATPEQIVQRAQEVFGNDLVRGVAAKLAYILREMPEMRPEGRNPHFKYQYWSTDQVTGYVRSRFGEMGLALMVDVADIDIRESKTAKGGSTWLTTLKVLFTVVDSETGEQLSGHGVGQGDDPGDKGANKAMTGALKYWLMKILLMGGEDPEADTTTDRRSEARAEGRNPTGNGAPRDVVISESKIEGIRRGGRANKATTAQVRQVSVLAGELGWNAVGTAARIGEWLGDEIELPDEPEERGPALRKYLESLDSDDIGKVVTLMTDLRDEPEEEPAEEEFGDGPYGY